MAITITGKKESIIPGRQVLTGCAAFSTTDTTGKIYVGLSRKVAYAGFTWLVPSTALSAYPPQVVGTPSSGNTNAYVAVDSDGYLNIIRAGTDSGAAFSFLIVFE